MVIEAVIIDYLKGKNIRGIGTNVYAETPVDPPINYVLIRRSGGNMTDWIRDFTVYTETISRDSKLTAATNHEAVVQAMLTMRDEVEAVFRCDLNSDYDATLTTDKSYRFQALWQITT